MLNNNVQIFHSLRMERIMEELKIEIRERGTFELLTEEIEKIVAREKEEERLFKEREKLKRITEKLQRIIDGRKIVNEQEKIRILNELSKEQVSLFFPKKEMLKSFNFIIYNL